MSKKEYVSFLILIATGFICCMALIVQSRIKIHRLEKCVRENQSQIEKIQKDLYTMNETDIPSESFNDEYKNSFNDGYVEGILQNYDNLTPGKLQIMEKPPVIITF